MMIHMSDKMLKKARFLVEKKDGELKIYGYDRDELKKKGCPDCLLKSFKKNQILLAEDAEGGECECTLSLSSLMSLRLDANKNKEIVIA